MYFKKYGRTIYIYSIVKRDITLFLPENKREMGIQVLVYINHLLMYIYILSKENNWTIQHQYLKYMDIFIKGHIKVFTN